MMGFQESLEEHIGLPEPEPEVAEENSHSDTVEVILIHGAGLGSWVWNDVMPHLNIALLAVDFPGRGKDTLSAKSFRLSDYCDHLLEPIREWDKTHLILVAHSIGGVVALKLAGLIKERIVGFIGISAAIPKDGGSFMSTVPFPRRMVMSLLLRIAGTKPPDSIIVKSLGHDLSDTQRGLVVSQFVPEGSRLYFDKCNSPIPGVTSWYIRTAQDQEIPLKIQDNMAENLEALDVRTLESGYLPMLSCPRQLAASINQFVESIKSEL